MADTILTNREMIEDILSSPDGDVVKSSSVSSKVTRTSIREEGTQRAVLDFDKITNDELDYFGDSELPGVWYELEADGPPARQIPYHDTPVSYEYSAAKYLVLLKVITTEEMTKNINHLRTYKTDVRQMVADNMLRDIHTAEDVAFFSEVDRIVGSPVAYATAESDPLTQNVEMTSATINRENLSRAVSYLTDRQLPTGVFVLNQRSANELLGWRRDQMGGDLAQDVARRGLAALDKFEMFGAPFVSTIKNHIIPNGFVYLFAPKDFLGRAVMLEDVRVTIKKEYDMIRMRAQEQVGLTIGNTLGCQLLTYQMRGLVTT